MELYSFLRHAIIALSIAWGIAMVSTMLSRVESTIEHMHPGVLRRVLELKSRKWTRLFVNMSASRRLNERQ